MTPNMRRRPGYAPVPLSASAALVLQTLRERRQGLASHNTAGLEVAAAMLAAMHEAAHGHVAALRADRSTRYRDKQLMGTRELGVVDLCAIAFEDDERGRVVALAGLAILAQALGQTLQPCDARVEALHESKAQAGEVVAHLHAEIDRAMADHQVDPHEAAAIGPMFTAAHERLNSLQASLNGAVRPRLARVGGGGSE